MGGATTQPIDYEQAQPRTLEGGPLAAAFLALVSLAFTGGLPGKVPISTAEPGDDAAAAETVALAAG